MNNAIQQGVYQEVHGVFHISDTIERQRLSKFKKNLKNDNFKYIFKQNTEYRG